MGKGKGSSFERAVCRMLSIWWTKGVRNDVFWRTAGSRAMAKTRSKTGKATFGQHGDVQATDPIGQPLINIFSIEIKRGYSKSTFANLVEPSTHIKPKPCAYETFLEQAIGDSKNAGSFTWLLIVKRDRKEPMVCLSRSFCRLLKQRGVPLLYPPSAILSIPYKKTTLGICITTLSNFLTLNPKVIKKLDMEEKVNLIDLSK